ncbi:MAG: universal stress protein [Conexibacter sp.]
MTNVLVVANDTHGGRKLVEAIQARAAKGDASFVVIAPQNKPNSGYVIYDEAVRDAAHNRVELTLAALRELGIDARGDVMDPDPFHATLDAVREYGIDEIIVSTHPETRSGWLRRDLIERVQDATDLPVEHVVVDLDADREEVSHTLVVANQTAGRELFEDLRSRAAASPHRFTVIVPQDGGDGRHTAEARERLAALLERLRHEGIAATGGIGDPDPFTAVMNALQFYRVDEIVISTLPKMRSRWLRSDLVERVKRATAAPVDHIVVDVAGAGTGDEVQAA